MSTNLLEIHIVLHSKEIRKIVFHLIPCPKMVFLGGKGNFMESFISSVTSF